MKVGFDRAVRVEESELEIDPLPQPPGLRFASNAGPMVEALLVDPEAFRSHPIPALTDLYAAAGFDERNGIVAPHGFGWDALYRWQRLSRFRMLHELAPAQAEALSGLLEAVDEGPATGRTDFLERAVALDDGAVAHALSRELAFRGDAFETLAPFVDTSPNADQPSIGLAWLRARVLDELGDAATASGLLEVAVDGECEHRPALFDLAAFRADRGDAAGVLRLLVQAGVEPDRAPYDEYGDEPDEEQRLWDEVEEFAVNRPRAMARRNDPCPCGSGRKYKACHLGRELHTLDDRSGWLYAKAVRFLRSRQPGAVDDLLSIGDDMGSDPDILSELADGPFIADIVLQEDGVFGEFLAARDPLLPDDEALLAAQWALVDRGVFEVLGKSATGLDLRNLATGDRIQVVNTTPGDRVRKGTLMLGRPLPVGDTYRAFSGFLDIPLRHHDSMLAAVESRDSEEIIEAIAAMFLPPLMTNTDGQDIVSLVITWRVPQPDLARTALVGAGLRDDGDDTYTLVRDSTNQRDTIIASLRLVGDELTVDTNSVERAAELQSLVSEAIGGAEIIDVQERSVDDLLDSAAARDAPPPMPDDPAIRAALAEHILAYERQWLDDSIPALDGMTPREATVDPIGREKLIRLLASLPEPGPDDVGSMDPRRIRAALGL